MTETTNRNNAQRPSPDSVVEPTVADRATVARELADAFTTAKRGEGEEFTKLHDAAPHWITDVVCEAHGEMFPNDWRYEAIAKVAAAIADWLEYDSEADLDDGVCEIAGELVDIYTANLTTWLASHLDRLAYCDDAVEELGLTDDNFIDRIRAGQYTEYREITESVIRSIRDRFEEVSE